MFNKMKKKCAESRFEELCRGQQASCIAEPASWTCKPLKRNFEEISTKTKTFRKKFQNNFKSSNPNPTSLPRGLVIGSRFGTIAVLKLKPALERPFEKWHIRGRDGRDPSFDEIWAIFADFCEKLKIFPKIFPHFYTLFEREFEIFLSPKAAAPSERA